MSIEIGVSKETVIQLLIDDPLYKILENTPKQEVLLTDDYLSNIVEKSFYPITEVAHWFGISDGQARYYLKPFHTYVFDGEEEEVATLPNSIRLNLKSILKLRMIILLKDEYKVKGLERLLGLSPVIVSKKKDKEPYSRETTTLSADNSAQFVTTEMLVELMKGLTETGNFNVVQDADNKVQIVPSQEFQQKYQLLDNLDSTIEEKINAAVAQKEQAASNAIAEHEEKIEAIQKQNQRLKEQLLAQRDYEEEALIEWEEKLANDYNFFKRIFKARQIEIDKKKFINRKVMERLKDIDDR